MLNGLYQNFTGFWFLQKGSKALSSLSDGSPCHANFLWSSYASPLTNVQKSTIKTIAVAFITKALRPNREDLIMSTGMLIRC